MNYNNINIDNHFKSIKYHNSKNTLKNINKNNAINILYLNAISMVNKLNDVTLFLDSFDFKVHVLVVTETRITDNEEQFYNIDGYVAYFNNRNVINLRERGGGVAVYIHSSLPSTIIHSELSEKNHFLIMKLVDVNMHVFSVYKPPNTDEKLFIKRFDELLQLYANSLVIGDFNLNMLNFDDNNIQRYRNVVHCNGFGFINKIDSAFPTRTTERTSTIIDHVLSNMFGLEYEMLLDDIYFSDHKYILLSCLHKNYKNVAISPSMKQILDYDSLSVHSIWENLDKVNTFESLISNLTGAIDDNTKLIPAKPVKNKNPWATNELIKLIKERNRFYKYKKKFTGDTYIENKYKHLKSQTEKLITQLKKNYFGEKLNSVADNPKKYWDFLKEAIFNQSRQNPEIIVLNKDGVIIKGNKTTANEMNGFFVNVAENLKCQLPMSTITDQSVSCVHTITVPFKLRTVVNNDVLEIIKSLRSNCARGLSSISTKIVKRFSDQLSPSITTLINECITNKTFPTVLKVGKVIPIFKSGDKTDPNNYRPITTLNVFSKIFEKILGNQLVNHLNVNNIITAKQFGFVSQSNTTNACAELTHFISKAIDDRQYVSCIFLDLVKAFDMVDHNILIKKLIKVGIGESDVKIFEDFLSNRTQTTFVNNEYSDFNCNVSGVPQGSILGPTLFTIFINDLAQLELFGDAQLYADDIAIKYSTNSVEELFSQMQKDIDTLQKWFSENRLILNAKKSKYILFGNHNYDYSIIDEIYKLSINLDSLERVNVFKYLGLWISSNLKWDKHIDSIKSRIVPYIFTLNKLKHIAPMDSLKLIYYSYIHSHLTYLNVIWSHTSKANMKDLFVLQKRAIKNIINVHPRYPSALLFQQNYRSIYSIIVEELALYIYKVVNNLIKHSYEPTQTSEIHDYNTRRRSHYAITNFKSNIRESNVYYKGFELFNKLPSEIRSQNQIKKFKKVLCDFLLINLHEVSYYKK